MIGFALRVRDMLTLGPAEIRARSFRNLNYLWKKIGSFVGVGLRALFVSRSYFDAKRTRYLVIIQLGETHLVPFYALYAG